MRQEGRSSDERLETMTANSTHTEIPAERAESKSNIYALQGFETARLVTSDFTTALAASRRAYMDGLNELSRLFFTFGKEIVDDGVNHMKATLRAKNLRDVAELQVAYAQHRVESAASHMQQIVELTRVKTEDTLKPIAGLVKREAA